MARPTSLLGTSAEPVARTASSTLAASTASCASSTGRPWHARRTPSMTLLRSKGSLTPLRLTTASTGSSTVVNRRPHTGHDRRRRVVAPSSVSRESMTRLSGLWQKGQRTGHLLDRRATGGGRRRVLWTDRGTSGGCPGTDLGKRLWMELHPCHTRCRGDSSPAPLQIRNPKRACRLPPSRTPRGHQSRSRPGVLPSRALTGRSGRSRQLEELTGDQPHTFQVVEIDDRVDDVPRVLLGREVLRE